MTNIKMQSWIKLKNCFLPVTSVVFCLLLLHISFPAVSSTRLFMAARLLQGRLTPAIVTCAVVHYQGTGAFCSERQFLAIKSGPLNKKLILKLT